MVKFIKCPDCGHVFKSPAADMKRFGYGFTIPGLGVIKCPSCNVEKKRKLFPISTEEEAATQTTAEKHHEVEQTSESDLIAESKYEDE